jgi:oxygen-independent coproporphyrinogen-3 oxidase
MIPSLYIHLPFCDAICHYCDFEKVLKGTFSEERYLDRLLAEIEAFSIPRYSLKTIYVGGGTPTALSEEGLRRLLSYLSLHFGQVEEFTVEANPESLTPGKALLFKRYGVNRVSLGVEAADPKRLQFLGRNHSLEDVRRAVRILKRDGIRNINLDFIYGLPGMTTEDLQKDLSFAFSLRPTHLSFYALQVEEGTVFGNERLVPLSDEKEASMYALLTRKLAEKGYRRYEVSNFALKGYESQHNLNYWRDGQYYAAGVSASGYLGNLRYTDTRSLTRYLDGFTDRKSETLTPKDEEFEYLMLHLRLAEGFSLTEFQNRFHKDFLLAYRENLSRVAGSVSHRKDRFRIRPSHLYTMDFILLDLLKFPDENR